MPRITILFWCLRVQERETEGKVEEKDPFTGNLYIIVSFKKEGENNLSSNTILIERLTLWLEKLDSLGPRRQRICEYIPHLILRYVGRSIEEM